MAEYVAIAPPNMATTAANEFITRSPTPLKPCPLKKQSNGIARIVENMMSTISHTVEMDSITTEMLAVPSNPSVNLVDSDLTIAIS